ncbi:MAG: hypothetical protein EPO57_00605 [Chitinophagaceae bacterium]|nr:MAG: hypothetical protein EPO57_00605 [Chitinophagaceae bacterium]
MALLLFCHNTKHILATAIFSFDNLSIFEPMKVFALIFSFYILALSLLPCTDKMGSNYLSGQTTSTLVTTDHGDCQEDIETCPPFCVCACYGQTYNGEYFYTEVPKNFNTASQQFFAHNSSFVSAVFFNIWQPPKIS